MRTRRPIRAASAAPANASAIRIDQRVRASPRGVDIGVPNSRISPALTPLDFLDRVEGGNNHILVLFDGRNFLQRHKASRSPTSAQNPADFNFHAGVITVQVLDNLIP